MTPLAPRTISALRTTRSCFSVDPHATHGSGPSGAFGALGSSSLPASDLTSFLFFIGLIATTFLL
jgi:hypothetical protein